MVNKEMNNKVDEFVDNLSEDEVKYLMYRMSKKIIIPQYYTKEHIKTLFENQYSNEYKSLIENTSKENFDEVFEDLRVFFSNIPQELEDTIHNLFIDFFCE